MEELDYKKLAQEKKDAILNDLKELIAIDSSEDLNNTSKEYPVGPGPVKAMKKFLSLLNVTALILKTLITMLVESTWVLATSVSVLSVTWMSFLLVKAGRPIHLR